MITNTSYICNILNSISRSVQTGDINPHVGYPMVLRGRAVQGTVRHSSGLPLYMQGDGHHETPLRAHGRYHRHFSPFERWVPHSTNYINKSRIKRTASRSVQTRDINPHVGYRTVRQCFKCVMSDFNIVMEMC